MRLASVAFAAIVVFGLVASASPAYGGTLCGTVRDAQSGAAIAHAGVFVRAPGGAPTSFYGATDDAGAFCIPSIPPGTYDLEVLVNDYQVAYVRNVEVTGTTDVAVPASTLPAVALAPPWPNPAANEIHVRWVQPRPASARLMVLDAAGRVVQGWSDALLPAGEHVIRWDLRAFDGRAIAPGCYFAVLDADGARRVRPFRRVP